MKTTFLVTEKAQRPARMDGRCFYCSQSIGAEHLPDCVLIRKKAIVEMTVSYEIDVPNGWDEEQVRFHRNESSWCASNSLEELAKLEEEHGCLCSVVEFEVVEVGTKPFLNE